MKKFIVFIFLIFANINLMLAQSIRKNYRDMTLTEKNALVNAFYQLRNGTDLIGDLASYHSANFGLIHFNQNSSVNDDIFLSWHRSQILELEHAMQSINNKISIPVWDWTIDNSIDSPLWDDDFMGDFDNNWSDLTRSFTRASTVLPTTIEVTNVQSLTNFTDYSTQLESGSPHVGAHIWIGGTMSGGQSPLDPVFYLHHGMVDKLWQEWVENNLITTSDHIFEATSMPRYDGTYRFNGELLALVNPNDIVDSKSLGVFYANDDDKMATLNSYSVSNKFHNQEIFYYQYIINAGDNFTIPSGKDAKIESVNKILLAPGFHAENGSNFIASIDNNTNAEKILLVNRVQNNSESNVTSIDNNLYENYDPKFSIDNDSVAIYPNPTTNNTIYINFNSQFKGDAKIEIFDLNGKLILNEDISDNNQKINLRNIKTGLYIIKIHNNGAHILTTKLSKF